MVLSNQTITRVGWLASTMAMLLFVSYIDQIRMNLAGNPGSMLIPAATVLNCLAWLAYGSLGARKDWPIICCNSMGVVLGTVSFATAWIA